MEEEGVGCSVPCTTGSTADIGEGNLETGALAWESAMATGGDTTDEEGLQCHALPGVPPTRERETMRLMAQHQTMAWPLTGILVMRERVRILQCHVLQGVPPAWERETM